MLSKDKKNSTVFLPQGGTNLQFFCIDPALPASVFRCRTSGGRGQGLLSQAETEV